MNKAIIYILTIATSLIVFYIIYTTSEAHDQAIFEKKEEEFPTIRLQNRCNCEIISIYDETEGGLSIRNNPNGALLYCKNRGKISIYTSTLELKSNKTLDDVIKKGALIYKEANNDTLVIKIKAENKKYKFIINN